MKLFLKIFGIIVAVIIVLMVAIPYLFRDQIVQKIKEEINKNVNATVNFDDFSLSLFRSFPDFNFRIEGLSVINKAPFAGDTLALLPTFELTLDLMSVIKGDNYSVKKIGLKDPFISLLVKEDGTANWDITLPSEELATTGEPEAETSPFVVKLKEVVISGGRIIYDDKSLATLAILEGLDHKLSGDFTMDFTSLDTYTTIQDLTVFYEGVKYLNKTDIELDAMIDADLVKYVYTLKENELRLNELILLFEGAVAMPDNGDIDIDLKFATAKSDFKSFLSLVPAIYSTGFEGLKATGTVGINGFVKGIYNDAGYPGFDINFSIDNGKIQYPDLPKSIDEISVLTKIAFPGGDLDRLVVDVSKFNFTMAGNHFGASLLIKTPMSDPDLKGEINGTIDLSKVKEVYPMEEELSGKITANVSMAGKMSSIENEKYDEFRFLGSLLLDGLKYNTSALPMPVNIQVARLSFSPEYLDLSEFKMNLGKNDLAARGKIEKFLPYAFADGTLEGNLEISSKYFNLTDLMPSNTSATTQVENGETTPVKSDTTVSEPIEIPGNIYFVMKAGFDKLIYDNIELTKVTGQMVVKDKKLTLDDLRMNVLDGSVLANGYFDTQEPTKPIADMDFTISEIDIKSAYNTFGAIKTFAPVAEKTSGKISVGFKLNTLLDNKLMPLYNSMNGNGSLKTSAIIVENVNTLNKIADVLKMPDLKKLSLSPINPSFEFINGKAFVKPFDIKYQDIKANIAGWTSFDQTMEYLMKLSIPRSKFGGSANAVLENLVSEANKLGTNFSLGETVDVNVNITGTITDPIVKVSMGDISSKNMMDDLKKKAQEEFEKQKQKLEEEARKELAKQKENVKQQAEQILADADKEAGKILAEAQKQADALNKTARESADKALKEADIQAQKLIAEGKKNGPIAELAAKKTAEKLKSEAVKKADAAVAEAKKQSDGIVDSAKKQADKLRSDAKTQSNKLLENK